VGIPYNCLLDEEEQELGHGRLLMLNILFAKIRDNETRGEIQFLGIKIQ
jgi:hypothetical protein